VPGPRGPVKGAIFIQECLADGVLEDKTFAPGYGEFKFVVPVHDEVADLAVYVPIDAVKGKMPATLKAVTAQTAPIFQAAPAENWRQLDQMSETIDRTWDKFEGSNQVPPLLEAQMEEAMDALEAGVDAKDADEVRQASIQIAHASLDVELRYRSPADVDKDRIGIWQRQITHDQQTGNPGDVIGDRATIQAIRDRIR